MIWDLWRTFCRSFFLQTLWNFERMQNIGFAFGVAPLLKRLDISKEGFHKTLRRHTAFFNTHPYFASVVMGVVFQKEKNRSSHMEQEDPTITVLKDSMGGAFGAVGDHVIWGTWRPFCAILALAVGALVSFPSRSWTLCAQWWVVGFLCLFNSVHLWLRWRGLQKAVTDGPKVVAWIQSLHLQTWAAQIRRLGLLIVSAMVLVYMAHWASSNVLFWMFSVLLGTLVLKRWSLPNLVLFYIVCGISMIMVFLGLHGL